MFSSEIEQEVLDAEVANIAACLDAGIKLCNKTEGGEGVSGYTYTDEQKSGRKIRATKKYNSPDSFEYREALRNGARLHQLERWNGPEGQQNREKQRKKSKEAQDIKWSSPEADLYREKAREDGAKASLRFHGPNGDEERRKVSIRNTGQGNPNAKINEKTAQAILDFDGSAKEAAKIFNCTIRIVKKIKSRITWRHLVPSAKIIDGGQ